MTDALVLAAGYGTRLQPYTLTRPKALVEVNGHPMIDYAIRRLKAAGVRRIVVNVHHFAGQIVDYLSHYPDPDIVFWISDETDALCDTGGGIRKALLGDKVYPLRDVPAGDVPLRQAPFFVYNADIWCDTDLRTLYEAHVAARALATLAVKQRNTSRALLVAPDGTLCGWRHLGSGEEKISRTVSDETLAGPLPVCTPHHTSLSDGLEPVAFSGIQVVSPEILSDMTESGAFSITDFYLRICATRRVQTWLDDRCLWVDMGNAQTLDSAACLIAGQERQSRLPM
ncbi:MAG: nucleotidyltransferase family protein [Bacteroidales bacterium]|nr:nucleotidyltransferase family protein [Bacteroidales bacterium]